MRLWFILHSGCFSVARLIWKKRSEANPDRLQTLGLGKRERAERVPALEGSS